MPANKGSRHHLAKLTEEDVLLILELNEERLRLKAEWEALSIPSIASKFGVSKQRVWEIVTARKGAWGHV